MHVGEQEDSTWTSGYLQWLLITLDTVIQSTCTQTEVCVPAL